MNPQTWWYLSRASGIVAWVLLAASQLWGILLVTRLLKPNDRPAWLLDLHRWLGALALATTGVHLVSLVADSYVQFGLADLVVPGASAYRTTAVALGVVSLWVLVAIEVTSLAMLRLPRSLWRGVHLLSYGLFWLVSLHAGLAGSDTSSRIYAGFAGALIGLMIMAMVTRILAGRPTRTGVAVPR